MSPKSTPNKRGESNIEASRFAPGFANLAGSRENALALAIALHEGMPATLTMPAGEIVSIPPLLTAMSWKDVRMALMLARDALQRYGIVHPTGAQLHASLCAGEAATSNGRVVGFRGVLRMRAEGLNWGRIAAERFLRPEGTIRRASKAPPEFACA